MKVPVEPPDQPLPINVAGRFETLTWPPVRIPRRCAQGGHGLRGSMPKTTKRAHAPELKTAVALEVVRSEKTLTHVASERSVAPSLACAWRDQLEQSAPGVSHHARTARGDHREVRGEAQQREGPPVTSQTFSRWFRIMLTIC